VLVGVDTESAPAPASGAPAPVELVQLAVRERVLLVHRRAGAGALAAVKALLENEVPGFRCVFAGAELAGDALGLLGLGIALHGGLDFTPLFSPASERVPRGLRAVLNDVFHATWVKDRAVTCSDWAHAPLSDAQLLYAVLDAWASELLGLVAAVRALPRALIDDAAAAGALSRGPLFSLARVPRALADALSRAMAAAHALEKAGKGAYEVDVDNVVIEAGSGPVTRVVMRSFSKKLRRGATVQAQLIKGNGSWSDFGVYAPLYGGARVGSPRSAPAAARPFLEGRTRAVTGKIAKIDWGPMSSASASTVPGRVAADAVCRAFRARELILITDDSDDIDLPLLAVSNTASAVVRAHPMHAWEEAPRAPAGDDDDALLPDPAAARFAGGSSLHVALALLAKGRGLENAHALPFAARLPELPARLNASQRAAVGAALGHRVSAVRGPPGASLGSASDTQGPWLIFPRSPFRRHGQDVDACRPR
jgi:hypothetical protein